MKVVVPDQVLVDQVQAMYAEAEALEAQANELPRWRPKRRRLIGKALITRQVAGELFLAHTRPQPQVIVVVQRRRFFF